MFGDVSSQEYILFRCINVFLTLDNNLVVCDWLTLLRFVRPHDRVLRGVCARDESRGLSSSGNGGPGDFEPSVASPPKTIYTLEQSVGTVGIPV